MNNILELSDKIDNEPDITKKIKMINELNIQIEKQREYYNSILLKIENLSINFDKKYLDKNIEYLEDLFNKSTDLEQKINIYYHINKYYNDKLTELLN